MKFPGLIKLNNNFTQVGGQNKLILAIDNSNENLKYMIKEALI